MSLSSTLNFELRSLTPVLTCLSYIRALNGHAGIACVQQPSGNLSGAFPQHMQSLQCITHGNVDRPFIICSVLAQCSTILWPATLLSFRDSAYTWQHFGQLVFARGLAPRDSEHGDRRLSSAAVFELLRPGCAAGQDSVFASCSSQHTFRLPQTALNASSHGAKGLGKSSPCLHPGGGVGSLSQHSTADVQRYGCPVCCSGGKATAPEPGSVRNLYLGSCIAIAQLSQRAVVVQVVASACL